MKANLGKVDCIIRTILAMVVAMLYYFGKISGKTALVLGIIALILLLTSLFSFCPLYVPFKISTKK